MTGTVRVRIPVPLRKLAHGQSEVGVAADTLVDVIAQLDEQFPGFRAGLCDDRGQLRRFMNLYVNGEDMRFLQGLATSLKPGDEVTIIPAAVGGSSAEAPKPYPLLPRSFSVSITAEARSGGRLLVACLTRGEHEATAGRLAQAVEWWSEPREVEEAEIEDAVRSLAQQALARVRELLGIVRPDWRVGEQGSPLPPRGSLTAPTRHGGRPADRPGPALG